MSILQFFEWLTDLLSSSIVVSIITALVTVLLTFWFYRIRDKLLALRSLKAEIKYNQAAAEELQRCIEEDNELRSNGKEIVESLDQFHTSAFENTKNRGVLVWLSAEVEVSILEYYSRIDRINQQIQQRASIRTGGRALKDYDEMMMAYNDFIQNEINQCGFRGLEDKIGTELDRYWPLSLIL